MEGFAERGAFGRVGFGAVLLNVLESSGLKSGRNWRDAAVFASLPFRYRTTDDR
jgi:hypothetical protein